MIIDKGGNAEAYNEEAKETDFVKLGLRLWINRRFIIKWGIIGIIVGVIIAFSIPKEYTAIVRLVPETGETRGGLGQINALASLAGFNLGASTGEDAVHPELYPDIVSSTAFVVSLFNMPLPNDKEETETPLITIISNKTSRPWWENILNLPVAIGKSFQSDNLVAEDSVIINGTAIRLTDDQYLILREINDRVIAEVDKKSGVITISATLQDPVAAACLADSVTKRLQSHIIEYRTEKARQDMEYARKINDEARENYLKAQREYAKFADRNQGLVSKTASIELERLQNEASMAFDVYNSSSQQVSVAEAKVQSRTPVFATLEPATIPFRASQPRKVLIVIICIFLAVTGASVYSLYIPSFVKSVKKKREEINMESDKKINRE